MYVKECFGLAFVGGATRKAAGYIYLSFACDCGFVFEMGNVGWVASHIPEERRQSAAAEAQAAPRSGGRLSWQQNTVDLHTKGFQAEWLLIPPEQWEAELLLCDGWNESACL